MVGAQGLGFFSSGRAERLDSSACRAANWSIQWGRRTSGCSWRRQSVPPMLLFIGGICWLEVERPADAWAYWVAAFGSGFRQCVRGSGLEPLGLRTLIWVAQLGDLEMTASSLSSSGLALSTGSFWLSAGSSGSSGGGGSGVAGGVVAGGVASRWPWG